MGQELKVLLIVSATFLGIYALYRYLGSPSQDSVDQVMKPADRVRSRPNVILPVSNADLELAENLKKSVNFLVGTIPPSLFRRIGTMASVEFSPNFIFVRTVKINSHDKEKYPPLLLNLYFTTVIEHNIPINQYMLYSKTNLSVGKISFQIHEEKIHITAMNSFCENHYVESFLVQLVIECLNLTGRKSLTLVSNRGSSLFYFKLGFLSETESINAELSKLMKLKNERNSCDGRVMYLPDESVIAWRESISQNSAHLPLSALPYKNFPTFNDLDFDFDYDTVPRPV